ncbi:hypothetical protein MtrunA17_Chr6g0487681 [Medicago truncatula]|uniref:Uncharacterized protein n=1 Tax=Medicago truncatula TaxID=3880 RepID=A0A396HKV0_MEDTR|nr:hypothetical protein MtrunA17_Chr6g0487681 [Medicago truncatula]
MFKESFYKARIGPQRPGTKIKVAENWTCSLKRPPGSIKRTNYSNKPHCTLSGR